VTDLILPKSLRHKFAIEAPLGAGAFGQVFRAVQVGLNRPIALKVIPVGLDLTEEEATRVAREGIALARLNHPNITAVFESGVVDGVYYLGMELANTSLRKILGTIDRSDLLFSVQLARQIVSGVAAAHSAHILHRDLKPENTLVFLRGGATILKLADFGLARSINIDPSTVNPLEIGGDALASTGATVAGTPSYISPECWMGRAQSEASDVFALGVILFELLTGQRPFPRHQDLDEQMRVMVTERPPSIGRINPVLPDMIVALVDSMLAELPEQRPTAGEAHERLADALNPFRVRATSAPTLAAEQLPLDVIAASQKPGARIDRYIVIGREALFGGTTVLRAWDPILADYVFIKRAHLDGASDGVRRNMLTEARTMARIRHPAVLRPRDIIEAHGAYCVIYEGYSGQWLTHLLHGNSRQHAPHRTLFHADPGRCIRLLLEVAGGLGAAHECVPPLIHGEVKPQIIFVTVTDRAVLALFEVVRESTAYQTDTGVTRGTPAYSSLEFFMGNRALGPSSDVFCLGCILYEMLCGISPRFASDPHFSIPSLIWRAHYGVGESFRRPTEVLGIDLPSLAQVEDVCLRALATAPNDRFRSMPEFASALREAGRDL
jgi:serine/threonine protein kinase